MPRARASASSNTRAVRSASTLTSTFASQLNDRDPTFGVTSRDVLQDAGDPIGFGARLVGGAEEPESTAHQDGISDEIPTGRRLGAFEADGQVMLPSSRKLCANRISPSRMSASKNSPLAGSANSTAVRYSEAASSNDASRIAAEPPAIEARTSSPASAAGDAARRWSARLIRFSGSDTTMECAIAACTRAR